MSKKEFATKDSQNPLDSPITDQRQMILNRRKLVQLIKHTSKHVQLAIVLLNMIWSVGYFPDVRTRGRYYHEWR